jgi:predicted acyl esterase
VAQDSRGYFDSEGEWYPFHCEGDGGYDTVEWAVVQPWANGKVGLFSGSRLAPKMEPR